MQCVISTICFALLCTLVSAQAPRQVPGDQIPIVSQTNEHTPDGGYRWSYEAGNGIKAEETGTLKKTNDPENPQVIVSQGGYSYTAPDGQVIQISYVADDEGGFQPAGSHLPTPPPIPPAIQRALDFIASQPQQQQPGKFNGK